MIRLENNEKRAEAQQYLTLDEVKDILSQIRFFPSSVAAALDTYTFDVRELTFVGEELDGFMIRCGFIRPDTQTGEMGKGYGRWNHVPKSTTVKGVVMTAYVAYKLIVEHEMMESFGFRGTRIIDPHQSLEQMAYPNKFNRCFRISDIEYDASDHLIERVKPFKSKVIMLPPNLSTLGFSDIHDYITDIVTNQTALLIKSAVIEEVE